MARAGGVSSCCIVVRIGSVPEVTAGPNEFVDATLGYTRYSPRHATPLLLVPCDSGANALDAAGFVPYNE